MTNFKLFTGKEIEAIGALTLKQKLGYFNKTLKYYCVEVDKENMIKAIRSIQYNGVKDKFIKNKEDYLELIFDYCEVVEAESGIYLLLQFDEVDEQSLHLVYKLNENDDIEKIQYELFEEI